MNNITFVLKLLKIEYIFSSTTGISKFRMVVLFFYQLLKKNRQKD